jgi:hypothetical protein
MIVQSSRCLHSRPSPGSCRTRRPVARVHPQWAPVFRGGRDCPYLPFFLSQAHLQELHEYTQEFGDDPSRPRGFSSPRRFSYLSLAQQLISSSCGAATLRRSKPFASPRQLLLEEDFVAGTIVIISLNEMSPRCRPQQHCRGKRHGKYTHNVMHDPSHRRYLQHQRQLRLSFSGTSALVDTCPAASCC